ncbi:putative choline/ethanolamine kinase [Histomonas meleagridis]|uniref:putative choline/ethanolamine kinase n=1 Tax=Histomonas meleagridis TaxID=135588 RepID=UPI003559645B|nr:putative choline/ethanolamine kinase [Histomonas meleagridis]KAH0805923.1 putative choline/ethanolamine kinase [Histomonas meleagridis]
MSEVFPAKATREEQKAFLIKALGIRDDPSQVQIKSMKGGITNQVFSLFTPSKKYVVKVFGDGSGEIINRKEELEHIRKINLTKIYAQYPNCVVLSYQEGVPLKPYMMGTPEIADKMAILLGKFHSATLPESPTNENTMFQIIQNFIEKIDPSFVSNVEGCSIKELNELLENMKNKLSTMMEGCDVVLCHNDLLAGNILWDGDELSVIDYEYSSYTWPHFDIANHFFEWCGFEIDLNNYPSYEQQSRFLYLYLKSLYGFEPDEKTVQSWITRIEAIVPLTCLYWGTWGIFQACKSTIDFPYLEYAKKRLLFTKIGLPLPQGHPLFDQSPLVEL